MLQIQQFCKWQHFEDKRKSLSRLLKLTIYYVNINHDVGKLSCGCYKGACVGPRVISVKEIRIKDVQQMTSTLKILQVTFHSAFKKHEWSLVATQ